MITDVKDIKDETLRQQAFAVMNRMLTAPKAKGMDDLRIFYMDGREKDTLTAQMRRMGEATGRKGYLRDAENVDSATGIMLIGARKMVMDLNCSICGAGGCAEADGKGIKCIFPLVDLGIAMGSGVSACQEQGLDNRIMYSVGIPCLELEYFKDMDISCVMGIPLSVSSKNVFFDRK